MAGCVGGGDDDGEDGRDGAASTEAPLLVGRVSQDLAETPDDEPVLTVRVNGSDRDVAVGDDLTFAVRALPTGDVTIDVEVRGIIGTVTLEDVRPGEVIEIFIDGGDGGLEIRVVRRDRAPPARVEPVRVSDETIEVRANGAVIHLEPGVYTGDLIIRGNRVTIVGASDGTCDPESRTYLEGDLIVRGNAARLVNVVTRGEVDVRGNAASFFDECRSGFDPESGPPRPRRDRE